MRPYVRGKGWKTALPEARASSVHRMNRLTLVLFLVQNMLGPALDDLLYEEAFMAA